MNGRLTTSSPSSAITTVPPANSTERPAVDSAMPAASLGWCPPAISWR